MSPCFLFLIWTVSQVFSTPMLLRLFVIFSGLHQPSQFFRVFLLPIFQNRSFFGPQGTWAPERCIRSRTPYRIGYLHSMKVLSFCFLLSFWTFGQFFRVFCFYLTAHGDSSLITVVYSEFLCFLAFSSVRKRSFVHTQETQTLENWNKRSTLYRLG